MNNIHDEEIYKKEETLNEKLGRKVSESNVLKYELFSSQVGRVLCRIFSILTVFFMIKGVYYTFSDDYFKWRVSEGISYGWGTHVSVTKMKDHILIEPTVSKQTKIILYDGEKLRTITIKPSQAVTYAQIPVGDIEKR